MHALNVMAPKLKAFFDNGGEGFASSHVDRNETIQNNVHQFTALLSYWYRTLNVDDENPNAFIDAMQLDDAGRNSSMRQLPGLWQRDQFNMGAR
jgi:hypothetical protein